MLAVERLAWLTIAVLAAAIGFQLAAKRQISEMFTPLSHEQWMARANIHAVGGDAPMPKYGEMRMLWQTPLYHVNARSFVGDKLPALHAKVAALVLGHFQNFNQTNPQLAQNSWQPNGVNQAFFEWQTTGGWDTHFSGRREIKELLDFFSFGTGAFLAAIGQDDTLVEAVKKQPVHAWATVNRHGLDHLPHTHPGHLVSGVYYVAVPRDAGALLFSDPRGRFPPFDDVLTITPKVGDLVIFPSWLTHQVAPTPGAEARIAIAFNMPGDWETTAGVSHRFDIKLQ